jgi:hypothetical protein
MMEINGAAEPLAKPADRTLATVELTTWLDALPIKRNGILCG